MLAMMMRKMYHIAFFICIVPPLANVLKVSGLENVNGLGCNPLSMILIGYRSTLVSSQNRN
jgi:hypothetical protein